MPALSRKLNAKNIVLHPHTRGETVGVKLACGEVRYVPWVGFIDVDVAKSIKHATAVKLDVARYSNNAGGWASEWTDLQASEYVQGCLTAEGVYGVLTTGVKIVTNRSRKQDSRSVR